MAGAAAGTLTFMVGADPADFTLAQPYLLAMGKNTVLCGGPGSGGVTKLCNNLALAISMVGTSEALALGVKLGMDPAGNHTNLSFPSSVLCPRPRALFSSFGH